MPKTLLSEDKIGMDQHARSPWDNARVGHSEASQRVSEAISVTITCCLREAAIAQGPALAFTGVPWMAALYVAGRLGPAPSSRRWPVSSSNRIAHRDPLDNSSIRRHKALRISVREQPLATICRSRFSPASSVSAHLRSSISTSCGPLFITMRKRISQARQPLEHSHPGLPLERRWDHRWEHRRPPKAPSVHFLVSPVGFTTPAPRLLRS